MEDQGVEEKESTYLRGACYLNHLFLKLSIGFPKWHLLVRVLLCFRGALQLGTCYLTQTPKIGIN